MKSEERSAPGGKWNYLFLLNFAFPVVFLLQEPPRAAAFGGALTAVVLALYLGVLRRNAREYAYALGMLGGIAVLAFALNPMYLYLAFLCADTFGREPLRRLAPPAAAFGALVVAVAGTAGWFATPTLLVALLPPAFGVCVLPFLIRASSRYRDMAIRLEAAQSQLERLASDAERRRIAGELHDTLGHTLTFIALKAELAAKLAAKDARRAAEEMEEVRGTARTALKQMRELVSGMRYVRLADEVEHARSLFAAAGVELTLEGDFAAPPAPSLHETILAMGLREAATNVVRHSAATACRIALAADEGRLRLTIADDGVGFGGKAADGLPSAGAGTGWVAMKERLQLIEGTVFAERSATGGAAVTFEVPIVVRDAGKEEAGA
ncbi:sensor histidine kinase [Paenibacillus sp.]|uniref:sensor histidine kinase n=1 Tax=Paenibacillus sp. TaxID=58172 RepID=UPI002810D87B|nr:sensor histidine kinase [Paenibacillus sp.]